MKIYFLSRSGCLNMYRTICTAQYVPHITYRTICTAQYVPHNMYRTICTAQYVPHNNAPNKTHTHGQRLPYTLCYTTCARVISSYRREAYENCALLGYCTASGGNFLLTFQKSSPLKMGTKGCPETSLRNYHYSLCNK